MLYLDNMFFRALLITAFLSLPALAGPVSLSLPDSLMALSVEVTRQTMSNSSVRPVRARG